MTLDAYFSNWQIVVACASVAAIALIVAAVAMLLRARRRAADPYGELWRPSGEARPARVEYRELQSGAREECLSRWRWLLTRFSSAPADTVVEADSLAQHVLRTCNIPGENLSDVTAMVPPGPAAAIVDFRRAHAVRLDIDEERVTRSDLIRAMSFYGAMFGQLLGTQGEDERMMSTG